ncbi:MAG: insulinase family protein [Bradyrhizobiaceae bacterium]|nr:MAG: insulinase family protein [Bradyrhizobiaceae bacterium]
MMNVLPRLAATGIALVCLQIAPASAAAKIQRVVSPGGIEAWFVQDATVPLIAMQFAFTGGSAQDPDGKAGTGSLAADTLDEGAGDLDSKTYHERLERRAIQMNFSVSRDYLRGSLRMLKENRDEAFDLLRLALTSPRFDAEPLERVRAQTLSLLRRESTSPGSIASDRFWAAAYEGHPYARPSNGTLESVPKIEAADLKDYVRRTLARDNLKIAVVGDVDAETVGKLLDKTFGGLPAKSELTPVANIDFAKTPQKFVVPLDVPQTAILFGGAGIARNDPDFMAAYIVNHIIGGGSLSSRLYHEVREKRGLVYSVSSSLIWMNHSSMFFGSTATRADKAGETLDTINAELKRISEEGPTQKELDEAKSYLKGSQMLALDSSTKFAGALVQYQLDNLGIDYLERRSGIIDAVTLDDAKRVAKRIWGNGVLSVSVGRAPVADASATPSATAPTAKN